MALQQVVTTKTSLVANLLRPDPTTVPRLQIDDFHNLLDRAVLRCTYQNIQELRIWISKNVLASTARVTSLCKYLDALAVSYANGAVANDLNTKVTRPSSKRKILHILYLLNDLLHDTRYHDKNISAHRLLVSVLETTLPSTIKAACSYRRALNAKHFAKLSELVSLWDTNNYFGRDFFSGLRLLVDSEVAIDTPLLHATGKAGEYGDNSTKSAKRVPWIMPATHGDPSTPWYDLPAGNLLVHITPDTRFPINPNKIKALDLNAGPAAAELVSKVESLLQSADQLFDNGQDGGSEDVNIIDGLPPDVDMMGQPLIKDESTSEMTPLESYYGWSIPFCEQMKARRQRLRPGRKRSRSDSRSQSRSGGSSRSRSRSRSRYGSRGFSNHKSRRNRSVSRSRSISRSRSRSRSNSRPGFGTGGLGLGHDGVRRDIPVVGALGQNRSRPPLNRTGDSRSSHGNGSGSINTGVHPDRARMLHDSTSRSRSRSRSRSYSPTPLQTFHHPHRNSGQLSREEADPYPPEFVTPLEQIASPFPPQQPPPPPSAPAHVSQFPAGPNGLPVPPRPPFYEGPWPPPPPPAISEQGRGFIPPPPPGSWQSHGTGRGYQGGPGR